MKHLARIIALAVGVLFAHQGVCAQEKTVEQLITDLRSPEANVRWQAADSLIDHGAKAAPAIPDLKDLLFREEDREVANAAAEALAAAGQRGIAVLADAVHEAKYWGKIAALEELERQGEAAASAVDSLTRALRSKEFGVVVPNPESRRKPYASYFSIVTLKALKAMGPKAKAALPALLEVCKETRDLNSNPSYTPRNIAAGVIEAVRAIDPETLPRLAEFMVPGLLDALPREVQDYGRDAQVNLWRFGPAAAKFALPRFKEMLPGFAESPDRPRYFVRLLAHIGADEGMAALLDFFLDPKTSEKARKRLLNEFDWPTEATPSGNRILAAALSDKSASMRARCVELLTGVPCPASVPHLVKLLDDPQIPKKEDPHPVAMALANHGKDAVEPLIPALAHTSELARLQAAHALAHIGKRARAALPQLEKSLAQEQSPRVQLELASAILALGGKSAAAQQAIQVQLKVDSPWLAVAIEIAGKFRSQDAFIEGLNRVVLESREADIRRKAVFAILDNTNRRKEKAILMAELLEKRFDEQDPFLRDYLFFRFEELRADEASAAAVVRLLQDRLNLVSRMMRPDVLYALGKLGPAAAPAIPDLIKLIEDDSLAQSAVSALCAIGDARKSMGPILLRFNKCGDDEKRSILLALSHFGPDAAPAVPHLIEWLPKFPDAAMTLASIGPAAQPAVAALEKAYHSERSYAKTWSAYALVKIARQKEPYVSYLGNTYLKRKDEKARDEAIRALRRLGTDARSALPALRQALKDRKIGAAEALAAFGPDASEAVPDLIDVLKKGYGSDKAIAVDALGAIGPAAREAIPHLEQLAEERDDLAPRIESALTKIRKK